MAQQHTKSVIVKCFTYVREEFAANAAITPGMLVEVMSTGKVRAHASAGQNTERSFAIEDELQGKGIDDDYSADNRVQVQYLRAGDIVNAILKDGENIAIGDLLESAGDGTLQKHTADTIGLSSAEAGSLTVYPEQIVGEAIEALDLSGSSGEESSGLQTNPRLQVRIV